MYHRTPAAEARNPRDSPIPGGWFIKIHHQCLGFPYGCCASSVSAVGDPLDIGPHRIRAPLAHQRSCGHVTEGWQGLGVIPGNGLGVGASPDFDEFENFRRRVD